MIYTSRLNQGSLAVPTRAAPWSYLHAWWGRHRPQAHQPAPSLDCAGFSDDCATRLPGTHDERVFPSGISLDVLGVGTHRETRSSKKQNRERQIGDDYGQGEEVRLQYKFGQEENATRGRCRTAYIQNIAYSCIPPPSLKQSEMGEQQEPTSTNCSKAGNRQTLVLGAEAEVVAVVLAGIKAEGYE